MSCWNVRGEEAVPGFLGLMKISIKNGVYLVDSIERKDFALKKNLMPCMAISSDGKLRTMM